MIRPSVRFLIYLILIVSSAGEKRDLTLEEVSSVKCFQNPVSIDCKHCSLRYL